MQRSCSEQKPHIETQSALAIQSILREDKDLPYKLGSTSYHFPFYFTSLTFV